MPGAGADAGVLLAILVCRLLLGRGEDARPLLDAVKEDAYPALYPDAVAQCIFDAAPLATCRSPGAWAQLWPSVQTQVMAFLVALEMQSRAPDLAHCATQKLRQMLLEQALLWPLIAEEYAQPLLRQEAQLTELCQTLQQVEHDRARCQQLAQQHEQTLQQVEHDRARWQQLAQQHEQTLQQVEHDRARWQQLAREQEQVLEQRDTTLAALERAHSTVEHERMTWQELAQQREALVTGLLQRLWVRLGIRLGLLYVPS
jgi:hypothetical protein